MLHRRPRSTARTGLLSALVLSVLLPAAIVRPATAQPAGIGALSTSTTLNADARARIEAYGRWWTDALESGSDIDRALDRLVEPVRGGAATAIFRAEYGDVVLDPLLGIVRDADDPQAVTAAVVAIGQVGSETALRRLVDLTDARAEPRPIVRQVAAHSAARLLDSGKLAPIEARTMIAAARGLRRAAGNETHHDVLLRQLQGIVAADDTRLPADARGEIYTYLGEAVGETATGTDPDGRPLGGASSIIAAIVLGQMLQVPDRDVQEAMGRALCPALVQVLEAYGEQWSSLRGGDRAIATHAAEVERIENALDRMVPLAYPGRAVPRTEASEAWSGDDAGGYAETVRAWRTAVR